LSDMHLLLMLQEVRQISKTRNHLYPSLEVTPSISLLSMTVGAEIAPAHPATLGTVRVGAAIA